MRRKSILLVAAFLAAMASLCAQQTSSGGASSSGGMSQGHEGGSHLSTSLSASASLADSVVVRRRFIAALSDSLSATASLTTAHRLPLFESLQAADSILIKYIANYRPTTFLDGGINQDGNPSPCTNDGNAIDGNPATSTICVGIYSPIGPAFAQKQVTYFGFPSKQGSPSSITLNVTSSGATNGNCTSFTVAMQYSLNNGSTWTGMPGQTGIYSSNTSSVTLGSGQDFTKVQVRGTAVCNSAASGIGTATLTMKEIWILAE